MKTCDTCKHWNQIKTFSPICSDGDAFINDFEKQHGWKRKILDVSTFGECAKIVSWFDLKHGKLTNSVISPLDVVVGDGNEHDNQWGSGGSRAPQTGPKFGCIHHELK